MTVVRLEELFFIFKIDVVFFYFQNCGKKRKSSNHDHRETHFHDSYDSHSVLAVTLVYMGLCAPNMYKLVTMFGCMYDHSGTFIGPITSE